MHIEKSCLTKKKNKYYERQKDGESILLLLLMYIYAYLRRYLALTLISPTTNSRCSSMVGMLGSAWSEDSPLNTARSTIVDRMAKPRQNGIKKPNIQHTCDCTGCLWKIATHDKLPTHHCKRYCSPFSGQLMAFQCCKLPKFLAKT